jgi:hypothetical protein
MVMALVDALKVLAAVAKIPGAGTGGGKGIGTG